MSSQSAPGEPMTPAAEGFAAMHEMYLGLRAAGFSLLEAAAIIAVAATQSDAGSAPA